MAWGALDGGLGWFDSNRSNMSTQTINGYRIRETIQRWNLRLSTALNSFEKSLFAFEGDTKETPSNVDAEIIKSERAIAALQTAQARFNLLVEVDVLGKKMTLCEAIKLVGGAGRREKLWRGAAGGTKSDRYNSYMAEERARERDPAKIYAKPQVTQRDALKTATEAAKVAAALRAAIAMGNNFEAKVDDLNLDASLLE